MNELFFYKFLRIIKFFFLIRLREATLVLKVAPFKLQQQQKKKKGELFFCKLFFLILLREAFWESKVTPTNRNSSAFLLHTRTSSNVELLSIYSQIFLELIFATRIKTMLLKQSAVLFTSCQKNIAYITSLNT